MAPLISATASNVLNLEVPWRLSLPDGLLQPGQSASVPVLCYGSIPGDHAVLFLFAYLANVSYRWSPPQPCATSSFSISHQGEEHYFGSTRMAHCFQVRPFLGLGALCRPATTAAADYDVDVEVGRTGSAVS
jgi:hypothetical protein